MKKAIFLDIDGTLIDCMGGIKEITSNVKVAIKKAQEKGDYVFKGEIVAHTKGNLCINIHSSVSGTIIDFVEKTYLDGSKVKCLKIENDFKLQRYDFIHNLKSKINNKRKSIIFN